MAYERECKCYGDCEASMCKCYGCAAYRESMKVDLEEFAYGGNTPIFEGNLPKADIGEVAAPEKFTLGFHDVERPAHYNLHPSGVEAIQITEHMNFCLGNAIKYIWRASLKNGLEDLKKAQWYINREIERIEKENSR